MAQSLDYVDQAETLRGSSMGTLMRRGSVRGRWMDWPAAHRFLEELGPGARRDLLRVLTSSSQVRADVIGQFHERREDVVAEVLIAAGGERGRTASGDRGVAGDFPSRIGKGLGWPSMPSLCGVQVSEVGLMPK